MNPFKITLTFLLIISYRLMIDFVYTQYLVIEWSYMGFYLETNETKLLISYLLLIFLISSSLTTQKGITSLFLYCLFVFYYIPLNSLYAHMDLSNEIIFFSTLVFFILFIFNNNLLLKKSTTIKRTIIGNGSKVSFKIKPFSMIISWSTIIYSVIIMTIANYNNISFASVLNLQEVYSVRENLRYPLGSNYFYSWSTKVLLPTLIYVYFINQRYKFVLFCLALQLWFYLITGHKLILFTILIVLLVLKLRKYIFNKNSIRNLLMIMNFAMLLSIVEILIKSNSILVDYILRRAVYIPALLTNYYVEYANSTEFRYWADSLLGRIAGIEKGSPPSLLIGDLYFGNPENNAVTGFLGSEYLNAGILGVLLSAIVLIILIKIIKVFEIRLGQEITFIALTVPLYTLWNTALLTSLLTGGVLISLLFLSRVKKISETT